MKIQDYLHLYLGCEVDTPHGPATFRQYDLMETIVSADFGLMGPEYREFDISEVKPYLRPLSDISYHEAICLDAEWPELDHRNESVYNPIYFSNNKTMLSVDDTLYLLKQGFDLFGLIDAGLAIPRLLNS